MHRASVSIESLEFRRLLSAGVASSHAYADGPSVASSVVLPAAATTTPQPTDGGVALTEDATQSFTARLGEFEFRTVDQLLDAQINWGDGSHSTGKIVGAYNGGEFYVVGTHTYANTGTFSVQVTINARLAGSPNAPRFPVADFTSVIKAVELKPTQGGVTLSEVARKKFTGKLGEFTFKTIDQSLVAVIYWGDGTKSEGKLEGSYATGKYYVEGTHSYAHTGTYKVQVKVFARPIGSTFQPTRPVAQFVSVVKVVGSDL